MFNSNHRNAPLLVGLDIGGSKIAAMTVNEKFQVYSKATTKTDLSNPSATVEGIVTAVHQVVAMAGRTMADVAAVGAGIPGKVDVQTGLVKSAVNLHWRELPAGEMLSAALGVPCFLENDTRLAAFGAYRFPDDDPVQNLAFVTIGTGIAAGLILNGQLYRGAHGMAGEIGHVVMEPEGPRCKCGNHGCLEALAAGPAIARYGQEAVQTGATTQLANYDTITAEEVYNAARSGDATALQISNKVGQYLGRTLQWLLMAYDVERIVLGGGVTNAGNIFLLPILCEWTRQQQLSELAREILDPAIIRLVPPGHNEGVWGAVALAEEKLSAMKITSGWQPVSERR